MENYKPQKLQFLEEILSTKRAKKEYSITVWKEANEIIFTFHYISLFFVYF